MPRIGLLTTALVAAALAAGCAKKVTVDASFTMPEGVMTSDMQLITYLSQANKVFVIGDVAPLQRVNFSSDGSGDHLIPTVTGSPLYVPISVYPPGVTLGELLSRANSEGLQVFRSEPNGSVRQVLDYTVTPGERWLDAGSEAYSFADAGPAGSRYIARGLVGGVAGSGSPLSNFSSPNRNPLVEIKYTAERWGLPQGQNAPSQRFQVDSLFFMSWTPVPGASRYLIHVYQFLTRTDPLTRAQAGQAAPVQNIRSVDFFIGTVPGNVTSYKLGTPGATVYTLRTPRPYDEYFVRIAALGSDGQMLGLTTGPAINTSNDLFRIPDNRDFALVLPSDASVAAFGSVPSGPYYYYYSLNSIRVSPGERPVSGGIPTEPTP